MNASERLQAIIKERREWESFGWGPLLTVWTLVLTVKSLVELWTGPRADLGFAAYLAALILQSLFAFLPGARSGTRQWEMHGLWALAAVSAWFFGSWAPASGFVQTQGAAVLEIMFLAAALAITGILKARRVLFISGATLAAGVLLVAVFPVLWVWRPLLLAGTFGTAAVMTLVTDRQTIRQD